jgi:voltage-gated potassium channel Kch
MVYAVLFIIGFLVYYYFFSQEAVLKESVKHEHEENEIIIDTKKDDLLEADALYYIKRSADEVAVIEPVTGNPSFSNVFNYDSSDVSINASRGASTMRMWLRYPTQEDHLDMRISIPIRGSHNSLGSILNVLSYFEDIEATAFIRSATSNINDIPQQHTVTANLDDMVVQFTFSLIDVVENVFEIDLESEDDTSMKKAHEEMMALLPRFDARYLLSVDIL